MQHSIKSIDTEKGKDIVLKQGSQPVGCNPLGGHITDNLHIRYLDHD